MNACPVYNPNVNSDPNFTLSLHGPVLYNCTEGYVVFQGNKVGQGLGFRPGYGRESRTITLENGNYVYTWQQQGYSCKQYAVEYECLMREEDISKM